MQNPGALGPVPRLSMIVPVRASSDERRAPRAELRHAPAELLGPVVPLLMLAALAMLSTAGMDMVVPLLGTFKHSLRGGLQHAGLVISMFPAGSAVAQTFCGPLSDGLGRRWMLIGGCGIYAAATLGCALSSNLPALAAFRFAAGAGAGVCLAITFAVVRDTTTGPRTSMTVSRITAAMWACSIVAVPVASVMLQVLGWRAVFFVLVAASSALTVLLAARFPETLAATRRSRPSAARILGDYAAVAASPSFRLNALMGAMAFSVLFTMGVGAGGLLGATPGGVGLWYGVVVTGLSLGSLLGSELMKRAVQRRSLQGVGVALMLLPALVLVCRTLAPAGADDHWIATLLMTSCSVGVGLITPCTIGGAVAAFPERAATAACLLGIIRMAVASAVSAGVVLLNAADPGVVAGALSICAGLAAVAWARSRPEGIRP